jgi:hypothetical protein
MNMTKALLPGFRPTASAMLGVVAAILLVFCGKARAQLPSVGKSSAPVYGITGVSPQPAAPGMIGTFAPAHKAADGRLCISVYPSTHPQKINPKIIDQIVTVDNICGQSIRIQICYANTSDCIVVPLTGYQKAQRTLGIGSGPTFKYEYRELY